MHNTFTPKMNEQGPALNDTGLCTEMVISVNKWKLSEWDLMHIYYYTEMVIIMKKIIERTPVDIFKMEKRERTALSGNGCIAT